MRVCRKEHGCNKDTVPRGFPTQYPQSAEGLSSDRVHPRPSIDQRPGEGSQVGPLVGRNDEVTRLRGNEEEGQAHGAIRFRMGESEKDVRRQERTLERARRFLEGKKAIDFTFSLFLFAMFDVLRLLES